MVRDREHSASFGSTQSAHSAGVGPPGDVRDRGASFSGDQRELSANPFQMGAGTPYRWGNSLRRALDTALPRASCQHRNYIGIAVHTTPFRYPLLPFYSAKSTDQLTGGAPGFDTFGFGQVGAASSPWSVSDSSNGYT